MAQLRQIVFGLILGAVLATAWSAFAKVESGSWDAGSVVLYGYNGSDLVSVKVDSNGYLVL